MTDPTLGVWVIVAAVPALALVRERARRAGRRQRLNRGLHELRRPLQALVLASGGNAVAPGAAAASGPGFLDLALSALDDLDRDVNGARHHAEPHLVCFRELAWAAIGRWRSGRPADELDLRWDAGPAMLLGEPDRLAQALDNLIANALEHGGAPLVLTASQVAGRVRITVADAGRGSGYAGRTRRERDPRRGHGLSLVSSVARAHGGRFVLQRSPQGTVAAIELPLAGPEAAAAA